MKKVYYVVLAMVFSLAVQSQSIDLHWGKELEKAKDYNLTPIGRIGGNLLGYKLKKGAYVMVKLDENELTISEENIIMDNPKKNATAIDNKKYDFKSFLKLKNKFYILLTNYDKDTRVYSLSAHEINKDGKLQGSIVKLSDIQAEKKRNTGDFKMVVSEDSTKFLVVSNPPYEKYAGEKFPFRIYDENLKKLHSFEVELPYKDRYFSVDNYVLSNDEKVYLLASIAKEKEEKKASKKAGESTYYYEIISASPLKGGEVSEYEIKLDKKNIVDVSFMLDRNNKILCAGFYSNIERGPDDINGIFYMRINRETKTVEAKGLKELEKDFIEELVGTKKANKGRGLASTFNIKNFVSRSDGGALIIAENSFSYVTQTCTTDPKTGARSCTTTYHYVNNNIIVININPDASIKWYANIPKYQHTTNDGGDYNSYIFHIKNDKMYFIYNDNPKNLDPEKVKTPKDMKTMSNPGKSVCMMVELSEEGKYVKKTMFNSKEMKYAMAINQALSIGPKEYLAFCVQRGIYCCIIPFKKTKARFVRILFN